MIKPLAHERLDYNALVIGSKIIKILKGRAYNVESLYSKIKKEADISLDTFFNIMTFLWLCEIVELNEFHFLLSESK